MKTFKINRECYKFDIDPFGGPLDWLDEAYELIQKACTEITSIQDPFIDTIHYGMKCHEMTIKLASLPVVISINTKTRKVKILTLEEIDEL